MATPPASPTFSLGVVILAAGASSRMGQPKLLMPWGATSVLGHLINQWQLLHAAQVAVVCAAADTAIAAELDRLGFPMQNRILNPTPQKGMFSSIQCAARWAGWPASLTHWAIVLGDQPHVQLTTLRALLEFAAANPQKICQPGRQGRARHPAVLPATVFAQLKDTPEENLKAFLLARSAERVLCEMSDPGLDFDIDEPSHYDQAVRLYFGQSTPS